MAHFANKRAVALNNSGRDYSFLRGFFVAGFLRPIAPAVHAVDKIVGSSRVPIYVIGTLVNFRGCFAHRKNVRPSCMASTPRGFN